jgi:hypothetical protein
LTYRRHGKGERGQPRVGSKWTEGNFNANNLQQLLFCDNSYGWLISVAGRLPELYGHANLQAAGPYLFTFLPDIVLEIPASS